MDEELEAIISIYGDEVLECRVSSHEQELSRNCIGQAQECQGADSIPGFARPIPTMISIHVASAAKNEWTAFPFLASVIISFFLRDDYPARKAEAVIAFHYSGDDSGGIERRYEINTISTSYQNELEREICEVAERLLQVSILEFFA
jgi:hypothetical protein